MTNIIEGEAVLRSLRGGVFTEDAWGCLHEHCASYREAKRRLVKVAGKVRGGMGIMDALGAVFDLVVVGGLRRDAFAYLTALAAAGRARTKMQYPKTTVALHRSYKTRRPGSAPAVAGRRPTPRGHERDGLTGPGRVRPAPILQQTCSPNKPHVKQRVLDVQSRPNARREGRKNGA